MGAVMDTSTAVDPMWSLHHEVGGTSMERKHLFTSEAVTEGHPDKVADAIPDAIVDAYLE